MCKDPVEEEAKQFAERLQGCACGCMEICVTTVTY